MSRSQYDFVELESEEAFRQLGEAFGGTCRHNALLFDNPSVKGQLIKAQPDEGLWIRKWDLNVFQKVTLLRQVAPASHDTKFVLVYFLNPSIFELKEGQRKVSLNSRRNNLFFSNRTEMDFSVVPKQAFYVVDITFTEAWLRTQFIDADPCFKKILDTYLVPAGQTPLLEACRAEEYKLLHDLDKGMQTDNQDSLFLRSRVYELVCSFFRKLCASEEGDQKKGAVHYDQLVQAEALMMQDLQRPLKIESIAREISMSPSTLLRQFRQVYGKSVHEYYVEKKMEVAKQLIIEKKLPVKEVARLLGYRQASPFIETFSKLYGCSPGSLNVQNEYS